MVAKNAAKNARGCKERKEKRRKKKDSGRTGLRSWIHGKRVRLHRVILRAREVWQGECKQKSKKSFRPCLSCTQFQKDSGTK